MPTAPSTQLWVVLFYRVTDGQLLNLFGTDTIISDIGILPIRPDATSETDAILTWDNGTCMASNLSLK
jgi:hypothetical protein